MQTTENDVGRRNRQNWIKYGRLFNRTGPNNDKNDTLIRFQKVWILNELIKKIAFTIARIQKGFIIKFSEERACVWQMERNNKR